jgi:hypothetical protein
VLVLVDAVYGGGSVQKNTAGLTITARLDTDRAVALIHSEKKDT